MHVMHFQYNDLYGHALALESQPWGKKFAILVYPLIGHHYYELILSDLCHSVDKKRRNIAFSLYAHDPAQEHLPWGSCNL